MAREHGDSQVSAAAEAAKKIAAEAAKVVVPGIGESAAPTGSAPTIEDQKRQARRDTREMQHDPYRAAESMKKIKKTSVTQAEAEAGLQRALSSPHAKEASWLTSSPTEFTYNPRAMIVVSRIVEAPSELQNDPHYLLSEGAKLFWSTNWDSLTPEARSETQEILRRIQTRIENLRASNPDFTIEQEVVRHNLEEENGEEQQQENRRRRSTTLGSELVRGIKDKLPGGEGSDRLTAHLDQIEELLNSPDPSDGYTMTVCEGMVHTLEKDIDRIVAAAERSGIPIDPTERKGYYVAITELQQRLQSFHDQDRIPSTIMLTRKEVQEILRDPLGFLERMANDIETIAADRGFDSPIIKQRLNRYELITDYFVSGTYDAERGLSFDAAITEADKLHLRAVGRDLLRVKGDILDQYTDRLHGIEFLYTVSQTVDFEKDTRLGQILDKISERGAFGMRAQYGGLAEVALQKMNAVHAELLQDPTTAQRFRSLPEVMEEVRRITAQRMLEEEAIWKPQYEAYLARLVGNKKGIIPETTVMWDKGTCDAITRSAEAAYMLFFEKSRTMISGLNPGDAYIDTGRFQTFITEGAAEKINAAFRIRDWHYRKWSCLMPGQRALWNMRARFYVERNPELRAWVSERTDGLWASLETERHNWEHLLSQRDGPAEIRRSKLFKQLRTIFSEYEMADTELAQHGNNDIHFMLELKRDKLYKYVRSDVGGEWAQLQGARCYGYWESGPRRELERDQVNDAVFTRIREHPIFKQYYPDDPTKHAIFIGFDIFEAQRAYFHADHPSPGAKKRFMEVLDNALRYRPQYFFQLRQMEHGIGLGENAGQIFKEANDRFGIIQARLMLAGEKPIDYSQNMSQWTEGQRAIVRAVFETVPNRTIHKGGVDVVVPWRMNQDQYFAQMKMYYDAFAERSYSGIDRSRKPFKPLTWTSRMGEFAHVRYVSKFAFVPWTDDVPVAALENAAVIDMGHIRTYMPQLVEAVEQYKDNFVSLSNHSTDNGRGRSGEWRRAWNDFASAMSLTQVQMDLLGIDEKKFAENLTILINKVSAYQGNQEAGKSALEAIAGFLGGARTKEEYTELLKGLKNSSEFKQWWGDHAQSYGLGEISELFDKFEMIKGKFNTIPGFEEQVKEFLGITKWRHHPLSSWMLGDNGLVTRLFGEEANDKIVEKLNENFPNLLYWQKSRNAMFFLLIILALFAADQVKKGAEGEKKSH